LTDLPGVEALQVPGHISHFSDTLHEHCVDIATAQLFIVNSSAYLHKTKMSAHYGA
jgi:hypothetical protein